MRSISVNDVAVLAPGAQIRSADSESGAAGYSASAACAAVPFAQFVVRAAAPSVAGAVRLSFSAALDHVHVAAVPAVGRVAGFGGPRALALVVVAAPIVAGVPDPVDVGSLAVGAPEEAALSRETLAGPGW